LTTIKRLTLAVYSPTINVNDMSLSLTIYIDI
jgi:hypothetical protein